LAGNTYQPAETNNKAKAIPEIDYSTYRAIRYAPEKALWKDKHLFEVQFFHPGFLYKKPVKIDWIDQQGNLESASFNPDLYQYNLSAKSLESKIGEQYQQAKLTHAGFRLHFPLNNSEYKDELIVFQGASYFRFVGPEQLYGLSARGLAIDTASAKGEEFPRFTHFWLVEPEANQSNIIVYALLDSPSVTGAYRFEIQAETQTKVRVKAKLYARTQVDKLGIAPLTSMFLHGENSHKFIDDFRPEIHDSDGLLMQGQHGDWTWRSLNNPGQLRVNSFAYPQIKGFGLVQRDREFSHYMDIEAGYEKRPSIWVETESNWGPGRVELVEIPTRSETNDNIVAYWVSDTPLQAGQSREFNYTLSSFNSILPAQQKAFVYRVRNGWATLPGDSNPPPKSHRQFIVDFKGGAINQLSEKLPVKADLSLSDGAYKDLAVEKLPEQDGWRVRFRLIPKDETPVDMRLSLKFRSQSVSEVWNYVWYPEDTHE